ncbi:MAG: hypothetical protein FJ098_12080 [Deltaproteobacteria bacterium]|nr:hypothetical protein [Deltaproteobacteria bacterium]
MRMSVVLLTAFLLLAPSSVKAAVMEPLTLDELVSRSDRVILGDVVSSKAEMDQDLGRISTIHRVAVRETWKGAPAAEVEVVTMGGETSELGQLVPGEARLSPGDRVVLFLRAVSCGYVVTGMALGAFHLDPGTGNLERDLQGIHFLREPLDAAPSRLDMDGLRRRVRGEAP